VLGWQQRALVEFAARLNYLRRMTAQATVANPSRQLVCGAVTELVTNDGTSDEERRG
jgi:hypothetical protein